MAKECVFCRIVSRELPSSVVYEDEDFVAFKDISPQAPIHLLVIPKAHIVSLTELGEGREELIGRLVFVAKKLAQEERIADRGYRLVINCGPEGGQQVPHLHLHLVGGRKLDDRLG